MWCTLGCGLVLTYGMKSTMPLCQGNVAAGFGLKWNFFQRKSYSNRLLIETSSGLSDKITRSQCSEIWVLWGKLLWLCLRITWAFPLGKPKNLVSPEPAAECESVMCARISPASLTLGLRSSKSPPHTLCLSLPCPCLWPRLLCPLGLALHPPRFVPFLPSTSLLSWAILVLSPTPLLAPSLLPLLPSFSFFSFSRRGCPNPRAPRGGAGLIPSVQDSSVCATSTPVQLQADRKWDGVFLPLSLTPARLRLAPN